MKNLDFSFIQQGLQKSMVVSFAALAFGCSSPQPPPLPEPASYSPPPPRYSPADDPQPHYTILVESIPPGAKIEFNDAFMGITPCRIRVPGEAGRKFAYGKMFQHVFKALPSTAGCYSQTKDFPKGAEIPERLLFDMRLSYR
jgi:hypothetical protein